jgi:hypothetical protein
MGLLDLFSSSSEPSSGGVFSLNSLLGTRVPEFLKANLTEDELKALQSQSNFTTGIGGLEGYASQLYQNKSPLQKILGAYTGASAGRQSPYTTTQQNLMTGLQGTKLIQDVTKGKVENQLLTNKFTAAQEAIANTNDPNLKRAYNIDPEGTTKIVMDGMFPKAPTRSEPVYDFIKALKLDPNNPVDAAKILKFQLGGMSQKDVIDAQTKRATLGAEFPQAAKTITEPKSQFDIVKEILQQTINNQPQQNVSQVNPAMNPAINQPVNINVPSTDMFPTSQEQNIYQQGVNAPVQTAPMQTTPVQKPTPVSSVTQRVPNQPPTEITISGGGTKPIVPENIQPSEKYQNTKLETRNTDTSKLRNNVNNNNYLREDIEALKQHAGSKMLFSAGGGIKAELSREGGAAQRLLNKITSAGTVNELLNMKETGPNGATPFGQLNGGELQIMKDKFSVLKSGANYNEAMDALKTIGDLLDKAEGSSRDLYKINYGTFGDKYIPNKLQVSIPVSTGQDTPPISASLGNVIKGQFLNNPNIKQDRYYYITPDKKLHEVLKGDGTPYTRTDNLNRKN